MMAVIYSYVTLILCLLSGGGNDLLDYLPTEAYWKEKKVEVSVASMTTELEQHAGEDVTPLIAQLGSPDAETRDNAAIKIREVGGSSAMAPLRKAADSPDAEVRRRARTLLRQMGGDEIERSVRRLMAIRTLGEIGDAKALPALEPLLQSKELFVADYAQTAIDLIEGRTPAEAARSVAAGVRDDVWLLPKDCRTLGQLVPRRGAPLGYAEFMAALRGDQAKKDEDVATVTRMVLSLVERIGNVRIDAVTFGIVGPLVDGGKETPSHVTVLVRGRYNAEWLRTLAKSELVPTRDVEGVEVFEPDGEQAWMMPSHELFVFVAATQSEAMPLAELARTIKRGSGSRDADDPMRKLVASVDTSQVLWAVAAVTPEQKALPVAGAFETITLFGTREGKTLKLTMTGRGTDEGAVNEAVEKVAKHAKQSADFLEGIHGVSVIRMAVELLRSIRVEADGTTATLSATLETTPAAVLSLPMLYDEQPEKPKETPAHPRLRQSQGAGASE